MNADEYSTYEVGVALDKRKFHHYSFRKTTSMWSNQEAPNREHAFYGCGCCRHA